MAEGFRPNVLFFCLVLKSKLSAQAISPVRFGSQTSAEGLFRFLFNYYQRIKTIFYEK